MSAWLRLLMVCCLVLAIPAQGIARVTMSHCGPAHGAVAATSAAAGSAQMPAMHDRAAHDHAAHDHAAHAHGPAADADALVAEVQTPAAGDTGSPVGQVSKCSARAVCGAATALPAATLPRLPAPIAAPAVFARLTVAVAAFATDGPERPPRRHVG